MHLRTPGREDEEDIETGTRAAAAGGYCQILAMPNTDPVVDSASILQSLRERAREEARVPTGFTAAITRGQAGEQLTEMAELMDAGAAGFTDDGLPVRDAGVLRQALQYQRLAGGVIALHEEDPALSGAGVMHEGAVSALLGLAGIPAISESTMIQRDCAIAGFEDARLHLQHLSARESVAAVEQAKQAGVQVTCEVTPHHLCLTDEAVRSLDASRFKMNPPLRSERRPPGADRRRCASGAIDCVATDHAPHAREEKEQPFEVAPMGVTGLETAFAALHTAPGDAGRAAARDDRRADDGGHRAVRAAGAAARARRAGGHRARRPRRRVGGGRGRLREPLGQQRVRRPDAHRPGPDDGRRRRRRLPRALVRDRSRSDGRSHAAYLLLEDGTRFDGESVGAPGRRHRRGRLQHRDVGLPGVGHRPELPRPDHRLHLPADRELRRVGRGDGVGRRPRARGGDARGRRPRGRARRRGRLAHVARAIAASRRSPAIDTRALVRHIRDKGAMRGGVFPGELPEAEARELDRGRAADGGPRPGLRGHARPSR